MTVRPFPQTIRKSCACRLNLVVGAWRCGRSLQGVEPGRL